MSRIKAWVVGLGSSALIAGAILAAEAVMGRIRTPPCPSGWSETAGVEVSGLTVLRSCTRAEAGAHAPRIVLYRTSARATEAMDSVIRVGTTVATNPGRDANASDPPTRATAAGGRLDVTARSLDAGEAPLQADVYLVAAGHRFGLLNIVHTPDAPFARPATTAAWMNTIEGVSPWGAPDAGPLRARCPDGFQARPAEGPRTVVRCISGAGTSHFTLVSFAWDDGGLASESERAQVASAIASRVGGSQGSAARVIEGPIPFTLARNVDAMHTRVETGETVPVGVRVVAARAVKGSDHVVALGIAEEDDAIMPVMAEMFRASGATAPPPWLTDLRAWALALGVMAVGIVTSGVMAGRKKISSP
jgi:hypothetical protein